jgi:hypothetical protein
MVLATRVTTHRFDPAESVLQVTFHLAPGLAPTCTVTGRLQGPFHRFADSVQIAYKPRPVSVGDPDRVVVQFVVPEPNLWSPATPYLYKGTLTLQQDDRLIATCMVSTGLRGLKLTSDGLRINGESTPLQALRISAMPELARLLELRAQGWNVLVGEGVAPIDLLNRADDLGFLTVFRGREFSSTEVEDWLEHPSFLGIVLEGMAPLEDSLIRHRRGRGYLIGVEGDHARVEAADLVLGSTRPEVPKPRLLLA